MRRAKGNAGADYQGLRASVKDSAFVHRDDTGWRVGGKIAYLMGFETADVCLYRIRMRHRNEEVREVIPGDYGGVMMSDRGRSYDAKEFVRVEQQKCLAHFLRNIADVVMDKRGRAREFGLKGKALLREAMELGRARVDLPEAEFKEKVDDAPSAGPRFEGRR